jgi:4-diphosphocytidyl-2-C-methyl-D-erythritol kinase
MKRAKTFKGLKVYSPAKINLFLEVISKRNDGYHEIESIMQAVNLYDTLYFRRTKKDISLLTNCIELPSANNNLIYQAAKLIQKKYDVRKGVEIELHKRIPIGGGLGGGSSNAAATLMGLNRLWKLGLSKSELGSLAIKLGSDVPFFIYGGLALVKGRGEIVFPMPVNKNYYYVLVTPPLAVPTKNIYKNLKICLTRSIYNTKIKIGKLLNKNLKYEEVQKIIFNRLEYVALNLYPILRYTYKTLKRISADGVSLSGSGSTFFKIFSCKKDAECFVKLVSDKKLGYIFLVKSLP